MKHLLAVSLLALFGTAYAQDVLHRGYQRQNGTYVQPSYQTAPNQNRYDNYSSQGNINPYTGQRGHERHEYSNPPAYNQAAPSAVPSMYGQPQRQKGW